MYEITEFESLRDALPISDEYDTANEIFIDYQRLMWEIHPEFDPNYDEALTCFYHERDLDILSCEIEYEKDLERIEKLDCNDEKKREFFLVSLDSYVDRLCDIGGAIYDCQLEPRFI